MCYNGGKRSEFSLLKGGKCEMQLHKLANIGGGQDGAIYSGILFRFDARGNGCAYSMDEIKRGGEVKAFARFKLDRADSFCPHSNAVCFGRERFSSDDEFPLLYSNIYNNYSGATDRRIGVTCVYRLQRDGESFKTTLVQTIKIGFTESALWKSDGDLQDMRPYGNFLVDADRSLYFGFVMRDADRTTAYFSFDLPPLFAGQKDPETGVNAVILGDSDIKSRFECPYHHFIQGACLRGGKIYSVEGFSDSEKQPAGLRVIDTAKGCQEAYYDLLRMGYPLEPELIDFYEGVCYYSDGDGNVYTVEF